MVKRTRYTSSRRRGVVAVQVAVMLIVLMGFAALTVDVGAMYNARGDLQRTADAAALGAASMLSAYDQGDPLDLAREAAIKYAQRNGVWGHGMKLDSSSDIVFGRANYDAGANQFTFTPTTTAPDAIRIRVQMSENSTNGPFQLFFARVFGKESVNLSAQATAIMVPRDIAVVADLSASHNDDSELQHINETDINLFDVWGNLPVTRGKNGIGNGIDPPPPGDPANPAPAPKFGPGKPGNGGADPGTVATGGQMGPTWGWMYYWGNTIDASYDPNSDPGLMNLPRYQNWNNADLTQWYQEIGYSPDEITALMSRTYDGYRDSWYQYGWTTRVAVALGLARWNSGKPGGLWSKINDTPGNGNSWVGAAELTWLVDYPFQQGSWTDYIYNYVRKRNSRMAVADRRFQYKFGAKTFTNYLLERRPRHDQTADLNATPTQPMQAVKDSVTHLMGTLYALKTDDRVSLEIYGTTARHEVSLTDNYYAVSDRLKEMQAGHYDTYTNMGGGIDKAIEELQSSRARSASKKVIVLLTDGKANVNEYGWPSYYGGPEFALAKAEEAAALGIRIFAVSVGVDADVATMQQIADIGHGEHFHAEGSIDQYSAQLDAIFETIGGRRPVALIQ